MGLSDLLSDLDSRKVAKPLGCINVKKSAKYTIGAREKSR